MVAKKLLRRVFGPNASDDSVGPMTHVFPLTRQDTCASDDDGMGMLDKDHWKRALNTKAYGLTRTTSHSVLPQYPPPPQRRPSFGNAVPKMLRRRRSEVDLKTMKKEDNKRALMWVNQTREMSLRSILREDPKEYKMKKQGDESFEEPVPPPKETANNDENAAPNTEDVETESETKSEAGRKKKSLKGWTVEQAENTQAAIKYKEAMAVYTDLQKLLQSQTGTQVFMSFLVDNLGAENLLFWRRCEEALKTHSSTLINELYEEFIMDGAPSMINTSGTSQAAISTEVVRMEMTGEASKRLIKVLTEMRDEIYELMERDLFARFVSDKEASAEWWTLCEQAVDELWKREEKGKPLPGANDSATAVVDA